jgi:TDG/mug DNA glycosylase family protein
MATARSRRSGSHRRTAPVIQSFPPIAAAGARVLVLGSMPGAASLRAQEYYAHPRNAFWPIVERWLGLARERPYRERCVRLTRHGIAVWDVLHACTRTSSLDSDIVEASIVPNDFAEFFTRHRRVRRIYFNGLKAAEAYRRYVVPALPAELAALPAERLPSTSPANARLTFEEKAARWRAVFG